MRTANRRDAKCLLLIVVVSLAVRTLLALSLDVFQDEVIYWWQSGEGVTFTPHPLATALTMRLGLSLLGHSVAGLRVGALLSGTALMLMAYVLGRQLAGRRAGLWAAGLVACCPLLVALGVVGTPDALLLPLWMLFMCVALKATRTGRAAWWAAAGTVLAAGLYAKYMMVLVVPCVGVALLGSAAGRRALRRAAPWIALSAGFCAFAVPFLIWDGRHGWPTLRYHLWARHRLVLGLRSPEIYVATHAGVVSPMLFVAVLWGVVLWGRRWRHGDDRGAWVVSFFAVPALFFLLPCVLTKQVLVRVQWDSMAYVAGLVGLACLAREGGVRGRALRRRRRWLGASAGMGALAVAVLLVLCLWPGLGTALGVRPLTNQMIGWRELSRQVQALRTDWDGPQPFLLGESFRTILPVAFHLDVRDGVYSLRHSRNDRYGLTMLMHVWGIDEAALVADCQGRDGIYIHEFRFSSHAQKEDPPQRVYQFADELEKLDDCYIEVGGRPVKHFGIFRMRNVHPANAHEGEHPGAPDAAPADTDATGQP